MAEFSHVVQPETCFAGANLRTGTMCAEVDHDEYKNKKTNFFGVGPCPCIITADHTSKNGLCMQWLDGGTDTIPVKDLAVLPQTGKPLVKRHRLTKKNYKLTVVEYHKNGVDLKVSVLNTTPKAKQKAVENTAPKAKRKAVAKPQNSTGGMRAAEKPQAKPPSQKSKRPAKKKTPNSQKPKAKQKAVAKPQNSTGGMRAAEKPQAKPPSLKSKRVKKKKTPKKTANKPNDETSPVAVFKTVRGRRKLLARKSPEAIRAQKRIARLQRKRADKERADKERAGKRAVEGEDYNFISYNYDDAFDGSPKPTAILIPGIGYDSVLNKIVYVQGFAKDSKAYVMLRGATKPRSLCHIRAPKVCMMFICVRLQFHTC